jgi:hypothetical protein
LAKNRIFEDAFNLLCDRKIGEGVFRDVYECRIDRTLVVKIETDSQGPWRTFNNVREMQFWQDNEMVKDVAKWLAPCVYLSPDGRVLCQKRVAMFTEAEKKTLPTKLPAFLTDTKYTNFGMYEGRVVCVDYASVIQNPSMRIRKAEWWEG